MVITEKRRRKVTEVLSASYKLQRQVQDWFRVADVISPLHSSNIFQLSVRFRMISYSDSIRKTSYELFSTTVVLYSLLLKMVILFAEIRF